jgi:hypothetical protein
MKNIKMFQDFKNFNSVNGVNENVKSSDIKEIDGDDFYSTSLAQTKKYTNEETSKLLTSVNEFVNKFNSGDFWTKVVAIKNGKYTLRVDCNDDEIRILQKNLATYNATIIDAVHSQGFGYSLVISIS